MSAPILLTADTLLSLEEAATHLGGRGSVVRAWLVPLVLPGHPTGRRVVRWGDVIERLRQVPIEEHPPEPTRPAGKLPRIPLGRNRGKT